MKYIEKLNKALMGEEEIESVTEVMRGGLLSKPEGGKYVEEFQQKMADLHGKKFAYATTSGTSALHVAVSALELHAEDEVIIPALANIADYSGVIQEGGKVVFADINSKTFNIDPADLERKITSKTKAVIVVHMYGQPAELDQILQIVKKNNLILIEDCAQAAGAMYKDRPVGSFGHMSCFSLYQTKHIVCGEGGVFLTDNADFIEHARSFCNNGIRRENLDAYDYDRIGYNYQFTDIQAAIGIQQLRKLNSANQQRRANVSLYKEFLSDLGLQFQEVSENTDNAYFYLAGLLPEEMAPKRDILIEKIQNLNTPIKKLYPLSLPKVKLVRAIQPKDIDSCPVTDNVCSRVFNLYVNPGLEESDIRDIASVFRQVYSELSNK